MVLRLQRRRAQPAQLRCREHRDACRADSRLLLVLVLGLQLRPRCCQHSDRPPADQTREGAALEHVLTIVSSPTCFPAVHDTSQVCRSRGGHAELAASAILWAWRCETVASLDTRHAASSAHPPASLCRLLPVEAITGGATSCSWCAQDPFDTSHDLGRTVDRQTCTFLRGEFERAARLLHEHAHPFKQLFEPSPTHNSK